MITLSWVLGLASVIGAGGLIALLVLFPAVVGPIVQQVTAAILRCKPCLIALAALALSISFFWAGYHQAKRADRTAELAAQLAIKNADIEIAKKAKYDETERANRIEEHANAQHQKDLDYINSLTARPACRLDGNDIGGLRNRTGFGLKKFAPRSK